MLRHKQNLKAKMSFWVQQADGEKDITLSHVTFSKNHVMTLSTSRAPASKVKTQGQTQCKVAKLVCLLVVLVVVLLYQKSVLTVALTIITYC